MKRDLRLYGKLFSSTFLLSAFTFGGGYVIVPLMKQKFVDGLHWIEEQEMLDLTAIAQSAPGPIAVNAAILLGAQVGGPPGAAVAILGTILPPFLILSVLSFFLCRLSEQPLYRRPAPGNAGRGVRRSGQCDSGPGLGCPAAEGVVLHLYPLRSLSGDAALSGAQCGLDHPRLCAPGHPADPPAQHTRKGGASVILLQLFFSFLQIGLFSFGGGYAALPLIQAQVVELHHWLDRTEFTDLITISQMTPGPIAINSATFVGIRIAGPLGAIAATLGCILPSCIIVSLLAWIYCRCRNLTALQGALQGLRPAVVALITSAGLSLLETALWGEGGFVPTLPDLTAVLLFLGAFFALRRWKCEPVLVMLGCGAAGVLAYQLLPGLF